MQPLKPIVPYTALVGQVVANQRERLRLQQGALAAALGLSQSAYSRIETGDTTMSMSQLNALSQHLRILPSEILRRADALVIQLQAQGVEIISERPTDRAPLLIGLGILAALMLSVSQ